jgi:hypothetical protein
MMPLNETALDCVTKASEAKTPGISAWSRFLNALLRALAIGAA